jgi:hypothetical protein
MVFADRKYPRSGLALLLKNMVSNGHLNRYSPEAMVGIDDFLAFLFHSLEGSSDGIDARCEPALEHCHRKTYRTTPSGILGSGTNGLILYIPSQLII